MPEFAKLVDDTYICECLISKVKEYYQDADNRKAFENWYKDKYGIDYEWRTHD